MAMSVKSFLSGVLGGILVSGIAVYTIGVTAAIAMPSGFPVALWHVAVVFGLGAFLPALVIHSSILLILRPNRLSSLAGFFVAMVAGLSLFAGPTFAGSALSAMALGALVATALMSPWSKNSYRANP